MPEEKFNRRNFMSSTLKFIAAAAGLKLADVQRLLAEDSVGLSSGGGQEYSVFQRSVNNQVKALKVLIENDPRVFENEYGRITPLEKGYFDARNPGTLVTLCRIEWFKPGGTVESCKIVSQAGGSCGSLKNCATNACNRQKCGALESCSDINSCSGQECPRFGSCGTNSQSIKSSFLESCKSDPYIQSLYKRFSITTAEALETKINTLLGQRYR
jgi:hypothetical protein